MADPNLDKYGDKPIFDLLYTSPPYFDYEIYSNDQDQSINLGSSEDEWLLNFLYPSLEKSIANIRNGGHIVLYLSQERDRAYVEKWLNWMKIKSNIYYLGNIFFSDPTLKRKHPMFIFEKNVKIPKCLYNPNISIMDTKLIDSKLHVGDKQLCIIRDDYLISGTFGRAIVSYLKQILNNNNNISELLYYCTSNQYIPVALACGLYLLKSNIRLRIFYKNVSDKTSDKINALISYIYPNSAQIHVNNTYIHNFNINQHLRNHNIIIPTELQISSYEDILTEKLRKQLRKQSTNNQIKRLWLVVGDDNLFEILYKILDTTHFCLVIISNRKIDMSIFDSARISIYHSTIKFYNGRIPYQTTRNYDGKIWEFQNYFENGDYIWNTSGIHEKI